MTTTSPPRQNHREEVSFVWNTSIGAHDVARLQSGTPSPPRRRTSPQQIHPLAPPPPSPTPAPPPPRASSHVSPSRGHRARCLRGSSSRTASPSSRRTASPSPRARPAPRARRNAFSGVPGTMFTARLNGALAGGNAPRERGLVCPLPSLRDVARGLRRWLLKAGVNRPQLHAGATVSKCLRWRVPYGRQAPRGWPSTDPARRRSGRRSATRKRA
jgi:hypothetical protein